MPHSYNRFPGRDLKPRLSEYEAPVCPQHNNVRLIKENGGGDDIDDI
jgi:hypothetical protein